MNFFFMKPTSHPAAYRTGVSLSSDSLDTSATLVTLPVVRLRPHRRTVRYRHNETVNAILQLFVAKVQNAMLSFHSG
jgi:hypothetical protein